MINLLNKFFVLQLFLLLLIVISCKKENPTNPPQTENRNFYMGFTPFPYDINAVAQNYVYDKFPLPK